MSRFSNALMVLAASAFAAACTAGAGIEGVVSDAPSSEVIVKLLNINRYEVLDTVKTDAAGHFAYKVEIEEGQPEFVYIFHKDTKIASLLLANGDKVAVTADTLGNYIVEGSDESVKLAQVEKNHAEAYAKLNALSVKMQSATGADAEAIGKELSKEYVGYYRNCVRYILENAKSLTSVPVLYQSFGPGLPVFAQSTDAIHFMNVADSLETVYPASRYVRALRKEAERRFGYLELESKIKSASTIGYPDIELPDINAKKVKLSEVDSKVTIVYFWNSANAGQKMFNLDFLKKIYDDYHTRGLEIYQVAIDADKASWAQVVKQQNLPWINVCDGLGAASPYIATYNLGSLPAAFIISDGELVDGQVVDEASLRKLLDKLLK